jgi:hypothetical protein
MVEASVTERMPDTVLLPNTPAAGRVTPSVDRSPSGQDPKESPPPRWFERVSMPPRQQASARHIRKCEASANPAEGTPYDARLDNYSSGTGTSDSRANRERETSGRTSDAAFLEDVDIDAER